MLIVVRRQMSIRIVKVAVLIVVRIKRTVLFVVRIKRTMLFILQSIRLRVYRNLGWNIRQRTTMRNGSRREVRRCLALSSVSKRLHASWRDTHQIHRIRRVMICTTWYSWVGCWSIMHGVCVVLSGVYASKGECMRGMQRRVEQRQTGYDLVQDKKSRNTRNKNCELSPCTLASIWLRQGP